MDPTGVDFRAFYPYTPNEVKHRKRTTSDQLKILEGIFKRDTKPNAALRTELASRLDMTPRGVQVWFQNRRAKEKTKASKAAKAAAANGTLDNASTDPSPSPSDVDMAADTQLPSYLRDTPSIGSHESSPVVPPSPHSHVLPDSSATQSWQPSPVSDDQGFLTHFGDHSLLRRGSLPVDMVSHSDHPSHSPPLPAHLDPFARRLSVDASMHRLSASSPYTTLARSKNTSRLSGPFPTRNQMARLAGSPYPRPDLPHIASAPIHGSFHSRHVSADARGMHFAPTGSLISSPYAQSETFHSARTSLPDNNLYAFSSRLVGSPIPGPLPSPGFSFGVANTNVTSLTPPPSADSERSSPDPIRSYTFQGDDSEDDHNSSYDALSRFGSITSVATSDTSNGSVYYPDCPVDHDIPPNVSRRGSCGSNQFLGMMSNLDVNGLPGTDAHRVEGFTQADAEGHHTGTTHSSNGSGVGTAYSSPSTISPGSTPSLVSRSSELAYALQSTSDQPDSQSPYTEPSSTAHDGQANPASSERTFMYVPDSAYSQSVASTENRLPPDVSENYQYDGGEIHQLPNANYYPEAYSVNGSFPSPNEGGDMNHYDHSSNIYGSYGTTSLENAPHSGTDFPVAYS
ncbi:hypothetical protein CPB85DRAFT_1248622 [Mucidula mucida]|nr:hypothetical protein CPB85DRAFT_1248622 [Mucidula mucida]